MDDLRVRVEEGRQGKEGFKNAQVCVEVRVRSESDCEWVVKDLGVKVRVERGREKV